jgi:hypothetical protein
MANTWGEWAQLNPSATTLSDLYTVPGATQLVGVVTVSNRDGAVPTTFRISVAIAGAANDNKQYKAYDATIAAGGVYEQLVACGPADFIRVYATLATLSFTLSGVKKT